jgi:hypothetical protein
MSLFYKSNEAKERKYVKENKIRELNDEAQQQIVDEQIDKELGLDRKATNIGLLSKRVADKLVNAKPESDILLLAINNGKLSELFDKIKLLPDSALTKNQQYIRDNLKVKQNKDTINLLIQEALPNGADAIKSVILEALGGVDNQSSLLDLISKADKLNIKDYSNTVQPSSKKSINRENELMANEDINYAVKPIPSKSATPAQIEAQNKAQANLDLISLFQQDVKEARKKQALRDLDQLSADEDLRLRKNFKTALEDMMDEVNNRSATAKAKKQYKEDKMVLDKMMNLIENQRMHDSFIEFSNLAIKEEFRKKLARNLESLFKYKKNMNVVNNYLKNERIGVARENVLKSQVGKTMNDLLNNVEENVASDMGRNNAAKTIQQRMAELRARKVSKNRSNSDETEKTSIYGQKVDNRMFNKGAPKKDTNAELNEFSDLLIKFNNSKGNVRSGYNQDLNNIIGRQKNLKIAQRMKDLKSTLHRK